jgi:hypothetical protein
MLTNIFTKKSAKFYLLQALLFLALVFAADRITGGFLQYLYKKQAAGWDYRTRYSAEETKADVLIFGASRAQQQYIPTFIEDSLQLTCYNVGRDGTPFFYQYAMLQMILKRYTPKIIILDCEYAILKKTATSYERMSSLLPLYNDHPEIRSIVELRSPYEKYKFISRVYPYNSMFFKIAVANLGSQKKKKEDIKGYLPLYASLNEPLKTIDHTSEYELDSLKIKMLYSFMEDCLTRNIELYLFCPPYYLNTIGTDHSFAVTKAIAAEKKVDFIDYSKDTQFLKSPHLFDDTVHVNYEGAKIISARIAGEIKKRTKIQ